MMTITKLSKLILFISMCFVALHACNQPNNTANQRGFKGKITGELVADTIIYSVEIKNTNPNDQWTEQCLSHLNRTRLVDQLFESVYNHKAQAYNYMTEAPMSVDEVKEIELNDQFSRDQVGKLQFWETWYFDEKQQVMSKKVLSILVAYEVRNDEGELLGHKAAFYIKTN